jgi:glycosyltransferase involved in cell wall biosynthesis
MRIAALTRYTENGASSRVRFHDWLQHLAPLGVSIDVFPLFDNAYLASLYSSGKKFPQSVMSSYIRRIRQLFSLGEYDVIWLEKEMLPFIPFIEPLLINFLNKPLIVDIDDAIFHQYDQHSNPLVRTILSKKIDSIFATSSCVIAGNSYLAERAHHAGAKRVEIVPTVVSRTKYTPQFSRPSSKENLIIGWIGSPATEKYLDIVKPVLKNLQNEQKCKISVIGTTQAAATQLGAELHKWSSETEAFLLSKMDIGIMPLTDSSWERGKCGYKLIQYMACGLPTVASDVGVNSQIVAHGKSGFLARTEEDWSKYLSLLLADGDLRRDQGRSGRYIFEKDFSYEGLTQRMHKIFSSLI